MSVAMQSSVPANALPRKSPWRLHVSSVTTLLRRVWTSSYEDGVYNRAAELAYFFFLSLFPGVIFITTLLGFVFKSNTQLTVLLLQYLSTTLPGTAFELIRHGHHGSHSILRQREAHLWYSCRPVDRQLGYERA